MAIRVEEYVLKGNDFVSLVTRHLGNDDNDPERTSQIITPVLHALRDVLTADESLHLIAQLPLYIKSAYVDGWAVPEPDKSNCSQEDFFELLRKHDGTKRYFNSDEDCQKNIHAVFKALGKYTGQNELQRVASRVSWLLT